MMSKTKEELLLLFEHPQEPVFMPKGANRVAFEVPFDYVEKEYRDACSTTSRSTSTCFRYREDVTDWIPVKEIEIPSLDEILELKRNSNFSLFVPKHRRLAGLLIDIFMKLDSLEDLKSLAVYAFDKVNPYLFNYAFSVALLHRPDSQDMNLPPFIHSFPDKFVEPFVLNQARAKRGIVPEDAPVVVDIPKDYTASDLEVEHRLAYFREDIGINLHHWHWHMVYPVSDDRRIVAKDRRGELFYYMHQQIIARYNFERFCNKLHRVKRFNDWRQPLEEGYFPKLDSVVANKAYPARGSNQKLSDVNRDADELKLDIADLERWRDRIYDAIHKKSCIDDKGETVTLTETEGIDILGNMIESSILSPDKNFYGNLHGMGHNMISYIHDPDHRHLEDFGVMGDVATAMRDPAFYRWHSFIDDMFQTYKATLRPYEKDVLEFPGITVNKITVNSEYTAPNIFKTFWQQSEVEFESGIDFKKSGSVSVRFTHLQHFSFEYTIEVNNGYTFDKEGTCRIFLAPELDEKGNPCLLRDQRTMFIELDKFTVSLKHGLNTISRSSAESSVTIPYERTFRKLNNRPGGGDALDQFNFCGCGWPQHMLIPKGTPEGMPCKLFVMISDYKFDKVDQNIDGVCKDAGSYCGIKDKLYPDRRAMGYPFDRMPRDDVRILRDFLTPNMMVQDVTIQFNDDES